MMLLHVGIASMRQFQHVPTRYITEKIRKDILKLHLSSTTPNLFASLQYVMMLPINIKIPVTIWQIVYSVIKFDDQISFC